MPIKKKPKTKRELIVIVRWKGKVANPGAPVEWATLTLTGFSSGIHFDKDAVMHEKEINTAIAAFLDSWEPAQWGQESKKFNPKLKRKDDFCNPKHWEFCVVAPLHAHG